MGADLLQRERIETRPERGAAKKPGRPSIWPFMVAGAAILVVVLAGMVFVLQEEATPYQASPAAIANSLANVREQGPYVALPDSVSGTVDLGTEAREGGEYASFPIDTPFGTLGASDLMTGSREGGAYAPWNSAGSSTEAREGGSYVETDASG